MLFDVMRFSATKISAIGLYYLSVENCLSVTIFLCFLGINLVSDVIITAKLICSLKM